MQQPSNDVIPLPDEPHPIDLGTRALWMLGVSLMVGVVVVAGLATAAVVVRVSV